MDTLEEMEEKLEETNLEAELIAQKARVKKLKEMYGSDWKRVAKGLLGGLKNVLHEPPSVRR